MKPRKEGMIKPDLQVPKVNLLKKGLAVPKGL